MRRVNRRDALGRPVDVTSDIDTAVQCPGCLSREVEPLPAVGFVDDTPVRRMRCRACRALWWRAGV